MKKPRQFLTTAFAAIAFFAVMQTAPTHAATLSVATGNDENTDNSSCSLSEAIENINDQAQTNTDCPAGDGVNDTINIPAGKIMLVDNLPTLTESAIFTGAGMGQTIIDGSAGQYRPILLAATENETLSVSDLTFTAFRGFGLSVENSNLNVVRVEVDGALALPQGDVLSGINIENVNATSTAAEISNVFIHDFDTGVDGALNGIQTSVSQNAALDININNSTIARLHNTDTSFVGGIFLSGGLFDNSFTPSTTSAGILNTTIHDIGIPVGGTAGGIYLGNAVFSGTSEMNVYLKNSTISSIDSSVGDYGSGAGVIVASGAPGNGAVVDSAIVAQNLLLNDNNYDGTHANCHSVDISALFGGTDGTVNNTITSNGGNLSSDTTCAPYFTHPKDQNNLTNLSSTLGPLQNNGGTVPTRALLQGSPAIDAGVTVAGLTQDARGSVRPQGSAYDSGAYESPFTTAVAAVPVSATLASTGQSQITLMVLTIVATIASLGAAMFVRQSNI